MLKTPSMSHLRRFLRRNTRMIRLLRNWRRAVTSKWSKRPLDYLEFRNGSRIYSPGTLDLAFLFNEIWVDRVYSPAGYDISDGDRVVDIGANIGTFAIYAATSATNVHVCCCEPYPDCVHWLRKNIEASGLSNIEVVPKAVAGRSELRMLQIEPTNWIVNRLASGEDAHNGIPIECVSLDDVFEQNQIEKCDLLKLDCEGSEYEILQQCRPETLNRVRRIVGEYHKSCSAGQTGESLQRLLEIRGFVVDRHESFPAGSGMFYANRERMKM